MQKRTPVWLTLLAMQVFCSDEGKNCDEESEGCTDGAADEDEDGVEGTWLQEERAESCYEQTKGTQSDCWLFSDLSMSIGSDLSGTIEGTLGTELREGSSVMLSESYDSLGTVETIEGQDEYEQSWSMSTDYYGEMVSVSVELSCSLEEEGMRLACQETDMVFDGSDIHEYWPAFSSIVFERQ